MALWQVPNAGMRSAHVDDTDSDLVAAVRGAATAKEIAAAVRQDRQFSHTVSAIKLAAFNQEPRSWHNQSLALRGPGGKRKRCWQNPITENLAGRYGWKSWTKSNWYSGYQGKMIVIFKDFKPGTACFLSSKGLLTQSPTPLKSKEDMPSSLRRCAFLPATVILSSSIQDKSTCPVEMSRIS